jgi:hypothetical protein
MSNQIHNQTQTTEAVQGNHPERGWEVMQEELSSSLKGGKKTLSTFYEISVVDF